MPPGRKLPEPKSPKKLDRTGNSLCISVSKEENDFRASKFCDVETVLKQEIFCSTCRTDLKPDVLAGLDIFSHPHLKVLLCEGCLNEYKEGTFSQDEDGTDNYCRWCAQGGTLYCCSKCVCSFCKKCVKQNFGREILKSLKDDDWECYVCKPEPLYQCRAVCYAAIQCSRNRRKQKNESRKNKVSELADMKRRGIKPRRVGPRHRKKSTSSDSEGKIISLSNSDTDGTCTAQKCLSAGDKENDSEKSPKHQSGVKLKKPQHLKDIKKVLVQKSSEDLTDSDFEPKSSQRFKPCLRKSISQLKETAVTAGTSSVDQASCHVGKIGKEDETTSSAHSPKPSWVLLDSHADDVACVAGVLNDQVSKFKKRYLDQSWEQYMMPLAVNDLQRYVKRAAQALLDVGKSLESLASNSLNGSHPLRTENKLEDETIGKVEVEDTETVAAVSNADLDIQLNSHRQAPNKDSQLRAENAHSDNSDFVASPCIQRCGSMDSDGSQVEERPCDPETSENPVETPNAVETGINLDGSCDLFSEEDQIESHGRSEISEQETPTNGHSSTEKSPTDKVVQSDKSLACKANLMASSSSESESEETATRRIHESDDNLDLDVSTLGSTATSNSKKSIFNVKDLDIYKADTKLQAKCNVHLQRLDEEEEKRHIELLGNCYDADSESDRSVDNLTNLANLKRKAKGSENDSDKSHKSTNENTRKRKKMVKKKSKEEEKLVDFLNKSNADTSETESSFEKGPKMDCGAEKESSSLNELKKKMLLMSTDSEKDESDNQPCSKDENKPEANEEEQSKPDDSEPEVKEQEKSEQSDCVETDDIKGSKCNADKKSNDETESLEEKKKDWRKDKLLSGKLSDTDTSDEERKQQKKKALAKDGSDSSDSDPVQVTKRKSLSPKKKATSDDHSSSTSEDFVKKKRKVPAKKSSCSSSSESDKPKNKKKRRRIKVPNSDSSDDGGEKNAESPNKGRKKIRHVIAEDELEEGTKEAAKEEEERLKRIAARQKMYEEVYDTVQKGFDVLEKLVLDFDEKTKEPLVEVDRSLVKKLKPHQGKGIKFMWDACFESIKRIESSKGSGCILAHCMGLGKTFQVVTLVHTLFKFPDTKVNTVLVVCPVSTVLNWVSEFSKWLQNVQDGPDIEVFEMTRCKQNVDRSYRLREWAESGGVMVIGYDMYRNLTNPQSKRARASIVKTFQTTLVDPGPDLVICDEGHLLKNEDTGISKALTRVKTLRRVILTGTPLQNNLKEYHCMVQFVKPNLLGTRKEFLNRFVNPITNGQFEDSTSQDVKRMKRRAHVLHKTLEGCVQRYDYSVLTPFLPPKEEYVISVRLTDLQEKLYRHYLEHFSSRGYQGQGAKLFADFQQLQRIWTHPRVLKMSQERNELKAEKEDEEDSEGSLRDFIDDSDESDTKESSSSSSSSSDDDVVCLSDGSQKDKKKPKETPKPGRRTRSNKDAPSDPEPTLPTKSTEWWESYFQGKEVEDLRESSKLVLLFSILKDCEENGEKLLVFSQSLFSLDVIEYFLGRIDDATQRGVEDELLNGHQGSWSLGIDYFRLDGQTPTETRSIWCNLFNKPSNLKGRLFLISTKAGGLGINLVAANRVIIFDASWNPSHDVQSIFRVYRFGQKKPCFIYRFLAQGTMEEKIYERQVTKLSLACRVVDELQIERYYKMADLQELYNFTPADRNTHILPKLPKDHLFAEVLKSHKQLITTYHEHDSLLENKEEEELNEDERKAAWEDYENEKKGPINQGVQFGFADQLPSMEQLLLEIKQKHPEKSEQEVIEAGAVAYRQMLVQQQQRQQQLQKQQQYFMQQQQLQQLRIQQQYQYAMQQPMQSYQQPVQSYQQQQLATAMFNQARMFQATNAYMQPRNFSPQVTPSTSMPSHSRHGNMQPLPAQLQRHAVPNPFSKAHKEP